MEKSNPPQVKVDTIIKDVISKADDYEKESIGTQNLLSVNIDDILSINGDKYHNLTIDDCSAICNKLSMYTLSLQKEKNRTNVLFRYLFSKKQEASSILLRDLVESGNTEYGWNERSKVVEFFPVMQPLNQAIRDINIKIGSLDGIIERIDGISHTYKDKKISLMQKKKAANG